MRSLRSPHLPEAGMGEPGIHPFLLTHLLFCLLFPRSTKNSLFPIALYVFIPMLFLLEPSPALQMLVLECSGEVEAQHPGVHSCTLAAELRAAEPCGALRSAYS